MNKFVLGNIFTALILSSCQQSWEDRCAKEAQNVTETTCPRMVTEGLVLDSMTYERAHNRFVYYYRVQGDQDNADLFKEQQQQFLDQLRAEYNNSIELKTYKDHDMEFQCIYHSTSTGQEYLNFLYTPADYKRKSEK